MLCLWRSQSNEIDINQWRYVFECFSEFLLIDSSAPTEKSIIFGLLHNWESKLIESFVHFIHKNTHTPRREWHVWWNEYFIHSDSMCSSLWLLLLLSIVRRVFFFTVNDMSRWRRAWNVIQFALNFDMVQTVEFFDVRWFHVYYTLWSDMNVL